jgi:protein-tyrosine phosphatase
MPRQRWLAGAPGARDLGGLPTADGGRIRSGVLYRAPALGRLTDADVATLDAARLIEVIDLRFGQEIVDSPADRLPAGPHLAHIPVHDPAHPVFSFATAVLSGHPDESGAAGQLRADGPVNAMTAVYRAFVSSAAVRGGFGRALGRVLAAAGRPVLYHCTLGKDRTGWLTAVLLGAVGVDRDTVLADYLRTNDEISELAGKLLAAAADRRGLDPALVAPVLAARSEYLDAAYDQARVDYGSLAGYLRDGLGLTDLDLAGLRRHLVEEGAA